MRLSSNQPAGVIGLLAFVAIGLLASAHPAEAQYRRASRTISQNYTVNGIEAWNTAKTNGFTFKPMTYASGQRVTRPYDGVNTRLSRQFRNRFGGTSYETVARIVGGNPSVTKRNQTVTFEMFGGQTLAPGWTIQSVSLSGSYVWDRRPQSGSQDPSFRIRITGPNSVTIRSLILSGPGGANPSDAFVGRKIYTINGIEAWGTARQNGFTFAPVRASRTDGVVYDGAWTTAPADGVNTQLIYRHHRRVSSCTTLSYRLCLFGQISGGAASVGDPFDSGSSLRVDFEMFGGKKLAVGWTVRSVELSSGTWIRRPSAGSDDLSLSFYLTRYGDRAATANIRSIVLEGPSNASSWREAFTNAR